VRAAWGFDFGSFSRDNISMRADHRHIRGKWLSPFWFLFLVLTGALFLAYGVFSLADLFEDQAIASSIAVVAGVINLALAYFLSPLKIDFPNVSWSGFERFTDRARKVMQLANQEAQRFNHEYIGTEHILLGLVKEGTGVAANVLKNLDIDLRKIRLEVEKIVQAGPDMVTMGKLPLTPRAKKVIEYATDEARQLNHNYVGTEHLLLGLLREEEGVAAQVLMNLGLKPPDVRKEVLGLLGHDLPKTDGKEPPGNENAKQ
jgi:hypothetical protein